jgi:phthiocerol/phenolphthiocerol synthesis type-I polyketide synthase E
MSDRVNDRVSDLVSDLDTRMASLDPVRRKLLERLMRERGQQPEPPTAPAAAAAPTPATPAVLDRERFAFDGERLRNKDEVRRFYDAVSAQLDGGGLGAFSRFLNFGYVPNDNPSFAPVAADVKVGRNPVRLVLEVIGDCPLAPQHRVLDVGCGRGGTVWVLRNLLHVGPIRAIDLAPRAIAFCRAEHRFADTLFDVADAEALPFAAAAFDAVTNIESSHCYPGIERFYAEVARVLRPGGWFLYTDLFITGDIDARLAALAAAGLVPEHQRDITSNVLLSCDETAATHARAFADGNDPGLMADFLGAPDSVLYDALKNGAQRYLILRCRKGQ